MNVNGVWLTPPQIAELLHVDHGKVLRWIDRGELKAINLADRVDGRPRWKISQKSLMEFLQSRTAKPKVPTRRRRSRRKAEESFFT